MSYSFFDYTRLNALLTYWHPLPLTSVALTIEVIPSTTVKGKMEMYDLVSHPIEMPGYRRITLIQGNEGQPEDDMRYRGHAAALTTHQLPLESNLQSCGCLDPVVLQAVTDSADAFLAAEHEAVIAEIIRARELPDHKPPSDWARCLLDGFVTALKTQSSELFLPELDELLR